MSDCFDNVIVEDLDSCVNEELASGISETEIYYVPAEHVKTMPSLPALGDPSKSLEDIITITSDIEFETGKGFAKMTVQPDTGEVKDELVGEKGNKKVKSMFDFYLSNVSGKNLGFLHQFKNIGFVIIAVEKSGRKRILGSKIIPAYILEASGTSGKGPEDNVGIQYSIEVTKSSPAPIYKGNIALRTATTTTTTTS